MAIPRNRKDFITYCLRKLGAPVLELNLDMDQIEDRVDEALLYFVDFNGDATEKCYYKYLVTPDDIQNQYITLPDNIVGAVDIFDVGQSMGTNNIFNIRYQIALNDVYTLQNVSLVPYYMALQNIQFMEQLLVGKQPLRYNRHTNVLHIDMDWSIVEPGQYIIVVAYSVIDPNQYPKLWGDRWLARYATCLLKLQWGSNLIKYNGMSLPGGVKFNGQLIYDQAEKEREILEKEVINTYSLPAMDQIY